MARMINKIKCWLLGHDFTDWLCYGSYTYTERTIIKRICTRCGVEEIF